MEKYDLTKIVEQYGVLVSSIAHRMIQNKEVAKEAAQEAWHEVLKNLHTFKADLIHVV